MESIILKVCIIYLIICFIFFVCSEILSNITARKRNAACGYYQRYIVNHGKIIIKSIFFPIAILMGIIEIVSELIFEKEIKKKGK